jgi:urea transporter
MISAPGFIAVMAGVVVSLGVLSAGMWRVAAAVVSLVTEVRLLGWRMASVERELDGLRPKHPDK